VRHRSGFFGPRYPSRGVSINAFLNLGHVALLCGLAQADAVSESYSFSRS
jgi:hypothetical protein